MKIGQLETKSVTPAVSERKSGSASTAVGGSKGSVEPSARVELSATISQLAEGGTDGVFDTAKVQRISDAIRDGKFEVNHEAIADKLIANAQELLGNVAKR